MDLTFPTRGVNVVTEFELQPVGTAPVGRNVRTYEPSSSRGRGGARPGLLKLFPDPVGVAGQPVQHLNFIVSQSGLATLTDFESEFADEFGYSIITDISSNCRRDLAACTHEDMPSGGTNPPRTPPGTGTPGGGPPGGPNTPGTGTAARNPPRYIRSGGSGVRPRRGSLYPPIAVDDTSSAAYGGNNVTVSVLSNDTYFGSPTVEIIGGPSIGSASIGLNNTIIYDPPESGTATEVVIHYRLTASGNRGSDTATVTITLTGSTPSYRLMCTTFTGPYGAPGEFAFPETVCACTDPATANYFLTFGVGGSEHIAGPFIGNTLPTLGDMNAGADASQVAGGSEPFSPPFYDNADGPNDTGPC